MKQRQEQKLRPAVILERSIAERRVCYANLISICLVLPLFAYCIPENYIPNTSFNFPNPALLTGNLAPVVSNTRWLSFS
jgi:hypothetical protein